MWRHSPVGNWSVITCWVGTIHMYCPSRRVLMKHVLIHSFIHSFIKKNVQCDGSFLFLLRIYALIFFIYLFIYLFLICTRYYCVLLWPFSFLFFLHRFFLSFPNVRRYYCWRIHFCLSAVYVLSYLYIYP